ncbi:MAG: asparagine synthase (glutamine-hydrolyzing) [Lachnospiraceae bacterium]|nr:asparagine synthase (glutamine-hydrolyzing) [Lachnospiraceae bacterium]
MCGIVGIIGKKQAQNFRIDEIRKMNTAIKHRGPDDNGIVGINSIHHMGVEITDEEIFQGKSVIAFSRLKIQDLSKNGHQPMMNDAHNVILVFNGEIYNFIELRKELQSKGYRFKGRADTEVILNLYLEFGIERTLSMLNGMFAIALYDLRNGKVYIARDRFGIKPLYFTNTQNYYLFASEIKCFLKFHEFESKLDEDILQEYILYRNVTDGALLDGVKQVLPGELIEISLSDNKVNKYKFFDINQYNRNNNGEFEDCKRKLWQVLGNAVERQMISDVKVGCQLSGGIDSSLISYLAAKEYGLSDTISIVVDDLRFSEEKYIDTVINVLNINSHKYLMNAEYYTQKFVDAVWHFEGIMLHASTVGLYQVAENAREKVTVLLSGEGSDEVFGGYKTFVDLIGCQTEQTENAIILGNGAVDGEKAKNILPAFDEQYQLEKRKKIFGELQGSVFDKQIKYEMMTYLPELLVRQDKMAMAHSIENRVPMLDNEVVEYAFQIPEIFLMNYKRKEGKDILKQMCVPIFGEEFAYRRKRGFGMPTNRYLFSDMKFISKILRKMKQRDILNWKFIDEQSKNIELLRGLDAELFFKTICFEVWCELFLDRKSVMEVISG